MFPEASFPPEGAPPAGAVLLGGGQEASLGSQAPTGLEASVGSAVGPRSRSLGS